MFSSYANAQTLMLPLCIAFVGLLVIIVAISNADWAYTLRENVKDRIALHKRLRSSSPYLVKCFGSPKQYKMATIHMIRHERSSRNRQRELEPRMSIFLMIPALFVCFMLLWIFPQDQKLFE